MAEPAETTETRLIYAEGYVCGRYIRVPVAVESENETENEHAEEPETDDHQD